MPTIAEAGYPSYDYPVYVGFLAPAGAQADHRQDQRGLPSGRADVQTPDYQEKTGSTDDEPVSSTPEEFAALTRADSRMTAEMVKAIGLKPE